jgi:hypothetical protein
MPYYIHVVVDHADGRRVETLGPYDDKATARIAASVAGLRWYVLSDEQKVTNNRGDHDLIR